MEPAAAVNPVLQPVASAQQLGAFILADLHVFLRRLYLRLVDLRPHIGAFVQAVSHFQNADSVRQLVGELVINILLHDHPAGGGAALAGSAKAAPHCAIHRQVNIGVVQHDDGILPAHLQRAMLETFRRRLADHAAHLARAGERYGPHVRMGQHGRARFRAKPAHDVHHAARQPSLQQRSHQVEGRKRRVFRRLDNTGVAAHQRGKQFPGRDRHGKIPRRDHAAHPDGHAHRHGKFVRQLRRHRLPKKPPAFSRHVVGRIDRLLHVAARLAQDLAHLACHVAREFFLALDQDFAGAKDDLRPLRRRRQTPFFERLLRRFHRRIHVRFAGALKNAHHVAGVRRIQVLVGLPGERFHPLAVDQIFVDFGRSHGFRFLCREHRTGGLICGIQNSPSYRIQLAASQRRSHAQSLSS